MLTRLAAVAAVVLAVAVTPAGADPQAQRTAGADRIDTAAAVAEATFAQANAAVLASAADYPDALAGAALAGALSAPVVLTHQERLPERTRKTLETLGVQRVVVLGGTAAVAETVEAELVAHGYDTERVSGLDRYATAAAIAERVTAGPVPRVLLVSGEAFADALVAGPVAYRLRAPILLTTAAALPEQTLAALERLEPDEAIVLGGHAVVSDGVVAQLEERGIQTLRVAGPDRTATAARFAEVAVTHLGFVGARVLLARGDGFADALAAAPRGGELAAPVLLTAGRGILGEQAQRWLTDACEDVQVVEAIGGPGAVSDEVLSTALEVAERCGLVERTYTYATGTRGTVHADLDEFRHVVAATLDDRRGWSLDGAIAYTEVAQGADFHVWLASPQAVESAAAVCHRSWSCRVGNHLYINDERWRGSTRTYQDAGRSLDEYRSYVINHELGHWLGFGHWSCPGAGQPAPVMQQQSIRLDGCSTNVWPVQAERDAVRQRHLGG